jgi:three-Cys-motif partner protein
MRPVKGQTPLFEEFGDPDGPIKVAPPQTQLKHVAYGEYVPAWLNVFKKRWANVHILDLYAGPGVYLVDGKRSPGSPVIAARALQAVRKSAPWLQGHLRCVEPNGNLSKILAAELEPYRADVDIVILKGAAQDHAAALERESRGAPTLVLMDPNGIEVPMAMIKLFGDREYTEVLISFDAHASRRVAGTEDTRPVDAFWGDETWERYRRGDYTIDLVEMLEGYRNRIHDVAGFRFSTVRRLQFPKLHIDRAIAQGAGSVLGPKIWREAFDAAAKRLGATVVDLAPLTQRAVIDSALVKLRSFAGRANVAWGVMFQETAGVCGEEELTQALLQFKEAGYVDWNGRLGRNERPAPKFTFADEIPVLRWDATERSEPRPRPRTFAEVPV